MNTKDRDNTLDALMTRFASADYSTRARAGEALARTKPRLQDAPGLKRAFRDVHKDIAVCAVRAVSRIDPTDPKVIDVLVAAATGRWECGCPQLFPEAIRALVKLAPGDARVVGAIKKALLSNNHAIRKHAILALHKLGSPAALETLRSLHKHLGKHPLCCERLEGLVATAIKDLSEKVAAARKTRRG